MTIMALSTHNKLTPGNAATVRHALKLKGAALHDGENVTLAAALEAAEGIVPVAAHERPRTEPWAIERQRRASTSMRGVSGPQSGPGSAHWRRLHADMDSAFEPLRVPPYRAEREGLSGKRAICIGIALCVTLYMVAAIWLMVTT